MRIVRESLYNFHKTGDVKSGLNIGIRTKITSWLDEMGVKNYTINENLTIDVAENVSLNNKGLTEFPKFIRFRYIGGWFDCSNNRLNNLYGSPKRCISFFCYKNLLTTLDGAPEMVDGIFDCSQNILKTLEGAPREVGRDFNCSINELETLDGAPIVVGGVFSGSRNSKKFTQQEVKEVCRVKTNIILV